jgi:hypothetical protein
MKGLPLKPNAEAETPKMSGLFEQTYYAAVNKIEAKPQRHIRWRMS